MTPINFYGRYFPGLNLAPVTTREYVSKTIYRLTREMLYEGPEALIGLCRITDDGFICEAITKSLRLRGSHHTYLEHWLHTSGLSLEAVGTMPPAMLRVMWLLDMLHREPAINHKDLCRVLALGVLKRLQDSRLWSQTHAITWLNRYLKDLENGRYD